MTPQEAIKGLKKLFSEHELDLPCQDSLEVRNIAIKALEKQIPKKATKETINRGIDISGEYDIDFNLCCPNCSAIVGTFEAEVDEYYFKYCPTCGQALDWSDTE